MGKLLNVGSPTGTMPQRSLHAASNGALRVVTRFDNGVQQVASFAGLSGYAASRFPSSQAVRNFNRLALLLLVAFSTLFYAGWRYVQILDSTEIPILGRLESDVNLYYPPIGNSFFPKVAKYNESPKYRPRTPLLIPFTRNSTMMKQTVLSYIAAGWPRADIVLIDNSGTMDANNEELLSKTNPFFLDYSLFRRRYGVAILQTPTLLSFAQLQNFMLRQAIMRDWPYYFWSHMDIAILSAEEFAPYKSFYHRILDVLDASQMDQWHIKAPKSEYLSGQKNLESELPSHNRREIFAGWFDRGPMKETGAAVQAKKRRSLSKRRISIKKPKWGVKMFAYDYLTLVNVDAWRETGQWDTFIPYYNTDCDFYQRMNMAGYRTEETSVGHVFDLADLIEDPEQRFFPATEQSGRDKWGIGPGSKEPDGGKPNSVRYKWLKAELTKMVADKANNEYGRNSWQSGGLDKRGKPGKDGKPKRRALEPWTYDPKGFQAGWWSLADGGRMTYIKKWGTLDCDLTGGKHTMNDMWLQSYVEVNGTTWTERNKLEQKALDKLNEKDLR